MHTYVGARFPAISFVYSTPSEKSEFSSVIVLRSGDLTKDIRFGDMFATGRSSPIQRLIHIQLKYASIKRVLQSNLVFKDDGLNDQSFVATTTANTTTTIDQPIHLDASRKQRTSSIQEVSLLQWTSPKVKDLKASWLSLGSLARISQLSRPLQSKRDGADNTFGSQSNRLDRSNYGRSTFYDSDLSSGPSEDSLRDGAFSEVSSVSLNQYFLGEVPTTLQSSVESQKKTNLVSKPTRLLSFRWLAHKYASHRSDWLKYFSESNWLHLVSVALRQATELARMIDKLDRTNGGDSSSVVHLSGPDCGRLWQPLLSSLAQVSVIE